MIDLEVLYENAIEKLKKDVLFLADRDTLNPRIWEGVSPNPVIKNKLMKISLDFYKSLELGDISFEDIVITGSNAGFNWNKTSDIDIHIVVDFSKFGKSEEIMEELLSLKRMNWNKTHKITIYGHEVEIYVQNEQEQHYSPGQYSLLRGEWVQNPTKEPFNINKDAVFRKTKSIMKEIDHIVDLYSNKQHNKAHNEASRLKEKLTTMRKTGLVEEGINSVENITFKMLRNSNYLTKLFSLKVKSYDKMMSLGRNDDVSVQIGENLVKTWKKYLKESRHAQ